MAGTPTHGQLNPQGSPEQRRNNWLFGLGLTFGGVLLTLFLIYGTLHPCGMLAVESGKIGARVSGSGLLGQSAATNVARAVLYGVSPITCVKGLFNIWRLKLQGADLEGYVRRQGGLPSP